MAYERPMNRSESPEILLCKYCGEPGIGIEGIAKHLAETAGDDRHPADPNPKLAGIRVPQNPQYLSQIGADSLFDEDAENPIAEFRRKVEAEEVGNEYKFVRVSELEDLYDEMLQKQDSAGWISATRRLREFIDEHS